MEGAWIPDDLWNRHTSQAACIQIIFFLFRILFKSLGVLDCLSLVACRACRESNITDRAGSNIPI